MERLIDGDATGKILFAWIAKEELRALLSTARTGGQRDDVAHPLHRFNSWCAGSDLPELERLAATDEPDGEDHRAHRLRFPHWTTRAAEYGSGSTGGSPPAEGRFPLKFEEPV